MNTQAALLLGAFPVQQTPALQARRQGRIINVTSSGSFEVYPYFTAYCASKAALNHLTNLQAAAVNEYGICIFALSPSAPTAMKEILATSPQVPEPHRILFRQGMEASEEMETSVKMLLFLVSGRADILTGRYFGLDDSPNELLRRADAIVRQNLYTMRLRL